VSAKLVHEGSGYSITAANITLAGKPVCDATLTLRVMDFPNAEVSEKMRETAARVGFPSEVAVNG
jgi:3-hydroxyacyl-[acyl-carrier-protein] dehydratase